MPKYVIADTSVLIVFDKLNRIDLLRQVYNRVITTPEVAEEFNETLPDWISVETVTGKKYQTFLETQVDTGEASVIALATERDDSLLILDDLKARKSAKILNLQFTGTLGVINKAKELRLISKVKPLLDKLILTDFRVSEKVIKDFLRRNNE